MRPRRTALLTAAALALLATLNLHATAQPTQHPAVAGDQWTKPAP